MTKREALQRLVAIMGHIRVRKDGTRSVVRPYSRGHKKTASLEVSVDKRIEKYMEKMAAPLDDLANTLSAYATQRAEDQAALSPAARRIASIKGNLATYGGSVANLGMKHRTRSLSEAAAERLLEGFGKKRKAHEYAKVGRGISRWAGRVGGTLGTVGGGVAGGAAAGGLGALAGGAGGGLLGYGGGRLVGGGLGMLSPLAFIDTARNALHVQRVKRLASVLRKAGIAGGAGAAALGGLAAYRKSKK